MSFIFLMILGVITYYLVDSFIDISYLAKACTWKFVLVTILLLIDSVALISGILCGARESFFQLAFFIVRKRVYKEHKKIAGTPLKNHPKVVMLYCTCNDFVESALAKSIRQNYDNFETIILDDSTKPEYIRRVDKFAKLYNLRVVRREEHVFFKAGNLNHYLKNHQDEYDYVAVLDSDERVPNDFIESMLKYFEYDSSIGAVQAGHKATEGKNIFQALMSMSVKSSYIYAWAAKNQFGFMTLAGHGMMLSKQAIVDAGFFPEIIIEDLGITMKLYENGYKVVCAASVVCEEEYPSNYIITKKRHLKWQEGGVELRKKMKKDLKSKEIPAFLRFDIRLHLWSLCDNTIFAFLHIFILLLFPFLDFALSGTIIYITIFSYIVKLLPNIKDLVTWLFTKDFWKLPFYLLLHAVVYTSYMPSMIIRIFWAYLGKKPFFWVTTKGKQRVVALQILKHSITPFVFVSIISVLTYFAFNSLAPSRSTILAGVLVPIFIILANIEFKRKKKNNLKCEKMLKLSQAPNSVLFHLS